MLFLINVKRKRLLLFKHFVLEVCPLLFFGYRETSVLGAAVYSVLFVFLLLFSALLVLMCVFSAMSDFKHY